MKVVLLENVDGLGIVGQEVKVKDGYARNYLIPTQKALDADDKETMAFKDMIATRVKAEAKNKDQAQKQADELGKITLGFTVKVGQEGKLFGSITAANIFDELSAKGYEIDKKKIVLLEPIRHVGTHEVAIRVYPEVTATVKVEVAAEEEGE